MCDICHEGGQVLGPFLKPMTHLIHTEYLLAGRSDRDHREILRDTMYAATVTGAPVENACRLIADYEPEGRGYYGAALALFGRSPDGTPTMDSPILIRTADVSPAGELKVTAGATLVRDSDAAYEVAETRAKAGGILSAFGLAPAATSDGTDIAELARDEDVVLALGTRNQRLSRFWLTDQAGEPADPGLAGQVGGDPPRRGRLREHARPRARGLRHDRPRRPARGLRGRGLRRRRPGHRRPRSGRPARGRPPQDRVVPPRRRRPARLGAAVPRRVPGPPDALPAPRPRPRLQGRGLPGHPVAGPARRPHRAGRASTTPSSAGSPTATRAAGRRTCRGATRRPATSTRSSGRTTAASSSTPSRSSPRTATTCSTRAVRDLLV